MTYNNAVRSAGSCGLGDAGTWSGRMHSAEVLGDLISREHCLGLQGQSHLLARPR